MRYTSVALTTKIDQMGHKIDKSTLQTWARQMADSEYAPASFVDHHHALPPIGKILNPRVEPLEASEHALIVDIELFEPAQRTPIHLSDGRLLVMESIPSDQRPFSFGAQTFSKDHMVLEVEPRNFSSDRERENLANELAQQFSIELRIKHEKGIDPVSAIALFIGTLYLQKVSSKLLDKTADAHTNKMARELSQIKDVFRDVIKKWRALPGIKGSTYFRHIVEHDPLVEFCYEGEDFEFASAGFMTDRIDAALKTAELLKDEQNAAYVQFHLDANCEWKFNFAATGDGAVIAEPNTIEKRDKAFKEMQTKTNEDGHTIGISAYIRSKDKHK